MHFRKIEKAPVHRLVAIHLLAQFVGLLAHSYMKKTSIHQQRDSGTTAAVSARTLCSPASSLSVTQLLQTGFRSSMTPGNQEQRCCIPHADRAGALGMKGSVVQPLNTERQNPLSWNRRKIPTIVTSVSLWCGPAHIPVTLPHTGVAF